jgi:hypothetical protein
MMKKINPTEDWPSQRVLEMKKTKNKRETFL